MKKILPFILVLALGIFGYFIYSSSQNTSSVETSKIQEPINSLTESTPPTSEKTNCGITASVTEGPYYVSGAPALVNGNLNYDNLEGSPLKISGYVYDGVDNTKPIANTTIGFWQTDTKGAYHPNANGPISKYTDDQISLRGTVTTDVKGYYEVHTIYPGEYSGRTRHIHVKARAPGKEELTTQVILSLNGDDISFDDDTVSRGLPSCHVLSLNATTPPSEATFDFRLKIIHRYV